MAVTPVRAGDFKPYVWAFSKPSQAKYHMSFGAQLPFAGRLAFGSDLDLPSALPRHVMNAPRSYVPSGTFWTRLRFAGEQKLPGLDETAFTMRYDPLSDFTSTHVSAGKRFNFADRFDLTFRDTYSFSTAQFDTEDIDWNTTKTVEFSLKKTRTRFSAAVNTARSEEGVWHSRLAIDQPVSRSVSLHASIAEVQTDTPSSVFRARFTRSW
ncbi:hypothetical protein FMN50_27420 [Rhodobacterales bacterium]|nr:hypothetical protein FMN50_27420 [Rhodobacterales bacterium]